MVTALTSELGLAFVEVSMYLGELMASNVIASDEFTYESQAEFVEAVVHEFSSKYGFNANPSHYEKFAELKNVAGENAFGMIEALHVFTDSKLVERWNTSKI